MASVFTLQERIAGMMFDGASLDNVESEVIASHDLSPEQRAGLWLYAFSFMDGRDQRLQARGYLAALER